MSLDFSQTHGEIAAYTHWEINNRVWRLDIENTFSTKNNPGVIQMVMLLAWMLILITLWSEWHNI